MMTLIEVLNELRQKFKVIDKKLNNFNKRIGCYNEEFILTPSELIRYRELGAKWERLSESIEILEEWKRTKKV